MNLCEVCRLIPFQSLPLYSDCFGPDACKLNDSLQLVYSAGDKKQLKWLGFSYHRNLESLRRSADAACPLCSLVHEGAVRFRVALDRPVTESICSNRYKLSWIRPVDYKLQMARLGPVDNGLVVFTETNAVARFYVIATIHISVEDDSDLAGIFHGRKIYDGTDLKMITKRLQNWLAKCDCVTGVPHLPTRVLDVGEEGSIYPIRLWETDGAKAHYVTLSHCWGGVTCFTTTQETYEERKLEICVQDLPKSFKDAVVITRSLGIRYLWIDSLCIIQGDKDDWEREGYKMEDVYSNSYLTIAMASASDDTIGCLNSHPLPNYTSFHFIERPKHTVSPRSLTKNHGLSGEVFLSLVAPGRAINYPKRMELSQEPLSTRAWTFQERALSGRSIFFCDNQMHFECKKKFRSEDGFDQERQYIALETMRASHQQPPDDIEKHLGIDWYIVVALYNRRKLTYEFDRLTALSGITKRFSKIYQLREDEFVAGLWKKTFLGDLLWVLSDGHGPWPRSPPEYHVPSWSWASCTGRATTMESWHQCYKLAKVADLQVSLVESNPFGRVCNARLSLQGPFFELFVDETGGKANLFFKFTTASRKSMGLTSYVDYELTNEKLKQLSLFTILIGRYAFNSSIVYAGLLVTPCLDGSNNYRRLGLVLLEEKGLGEYAPKNGDKFPVTTLV